MLKLCECSRRFRDWNETCKKNHKFLEYMIFFVYFANGVIFSKGANYTFSIPKIRELGHI